VTNGKALFVLRDDGQVFGELPDPKTKALHELGLDVRLQAGVIPDSRLWSTMGVVAYRAGRRPEPKELFGKLTDAIDRFIDFDQSLAEQAEMCEFMACVILSTWMLEAFTVIGYVWPTGEPGSGKTQLLNICTELSYLGQTILAGSTYATLRDLADYGATLGFDDAERVFNPRTKDPDKRNLLLSGNRRGNTIALKEAGVAGAIAGKFTVSRKCLSIKELASPKTCNNAGPAKESCGRSPIITSRGMLRTPYFC
jgi:hypothetical protein